MKLKIGKAMLAAAMVSIVSYAGTIISPSNILNSPSEVAPTHGASIFAIDQGGLSLNFTSGITDFDAYIASNPSHTIFSDQEWFTSSGVTTESLDLDLGGSFDLKRFALWNEEFTGVGSVEVFSSADATFSSITSLGSFAPIDTPNGWYPVEVFDIADATTRFVRVTFTDSGIGNNRIAVGEIAFDGIAIPEPSTIAFVGVFGSGLLVVRRYFPRV